MIRDSQRENVLLLAVVGKDSQNCDKIIFRGKI